MGQLKCWRFWLMSHTWRSAAHVDEDTERMTTVDIDKIRSIRALVSVETPDSTVPVPVSDLRDLLDAAEREQGNA